MENTALKFHAVEVSADNDDAGNLVIYFGGEEHYLMIQYADEYDEQDRALGMDTYHIERDDQSHGGYGGVTGHVLEKDKLTLRLDEIGEKNLGVNGLEISFDVPAEKLRYLKDHLEAIFAPGN